MNALRHAAALSLLLAIAASAQVRFETGGGASHLDLLQASSLTAFHGGVDVANGPLLFHATGGADDHINVGVMGTASGTLHYQMQPGAWRIEFGPSLMAARDIGAQWSHAWSGDVSADRDIGPVTLHTGWQLGSAQSTTHPIAWMRPAIGVEYRAGNFTVGAAWPGRFARDTTQVTFAPLADTSGNRQVDTITRSPIRDIHDVSMKAAWHSPLISVDARVVQRFGSSIRSQVWWESVAALHLTPMVSLTLQSGRLASDVLLNLRGGRYTTLGLRFDLLQQKPPAATDNFAPLVIDRERDDMVRLTFRLPPTVRDAAMTSDLTGWEPLPLRRTDDGRWEVVVEWKKGVHRMNLRYGLGEWQVPPGMPGVDDGFGSKVGLLIFEK